MENVGGECKGMYNYSNIEVQCWIILQAGNMHVVDKKMINF